MTSTPTTIGYMVGRFNPLQKGHLVLLQHTCDSNDHMVVLVGSATESRTHKNPLTFEERKSLILASFPNAVVMPLPDMPSDEDWVKMFETTISMGIDSLRLSGPIHARLYSADATRADDYALRCDWVKNLGHEVVPFKPVTARTDLSASLVRDSWYNGRYEEVREFVPEATFELLQRLDIAWMKTHYVKKVGLLERAARNAVFVAFVSEPEHIYQVDAECRVWGEDVWNAKLSLLGHVVRWNGEMGFVGGMAASDESLEDAVVRECQREIGYDLDPSALTPVCSHSMVGKGPGQHTHLFICRVSADEMYRVRRASVEAPQSRTQVSAFAVTHMTPDAPDVLLAQKWAGTAADALKSLLYSGLVPPAQVIVNGH